MKIKLGLLLFYFIFLMFCGCETTKGMVGGLKGTAKGFATDVTNVCTGVWGAIQKTDDWMQENLW